MKLFKVERTDEWSYDDYDSFIVVANSEEEARWTAPDPEFHMWKDGVYCYSYRDQKPVDTRYSSWVKNPETQLKITEIDPSFFTKPEVILTSFNPG